MNMVIAPKVVCVDLTEVEKAFGLQTTYFAGVVKVGEVYLCVDGTTDRGDGWLGPVSQKLEEQFGCRQDEDDMTLNEELSLGSIFEVSWNGTKFLVKDIGAKFAAASPNHSVDPKTAQVVTILQKLQANLGNCLQTIAAELPIEANRALSCALSEVHSLAADAIELLDPTIER
jgi:hypothetical protein